ncbi:MAG: hypothetical protein K9K93_01580 [Acholeplasmataceae bacterium]|nr:hypothetical protein [Acholeplasmataceae bacterium]
MELLILFGAMFVLFVLFFGTMYLNAITPISDECREAYRSVKACDSCILHEVGCGFRDAIEYMKEVKLND